MEIGNETILHLICFGTDKTHPNIGFHGFQGLLRLCRYTRQHNLLLSKVF